MGQHTRLLSRPCLWIWFGARVLPAAVPCLLLRSHPAGRIDLTTKTLPGLEQLTALEALQLLHTHLQPSCLLSVTTGLTKLRVDRALIQPHAGGSTAPMLQLLARLPALHTLDLRHIVGNWPQQQLAVYSALTASSHLRELRVYTCKIPSAVWAHVFPAGGLLPHLQKFKVYPWGIALDSPGPGPFDSTGIVRLASCCPALDNLGFQPGCCVCAQCAHMLHWLPFTPSQR